jgi:hypothetical protein
MPQVTNTFIRSKMNKDLDARLLPNGEYRDAKNLQLSRSEGSEVGEFENIPGNIELTGLKTGLGAKVVGQFTDETNNILYVYSAGYTGEDRCPRDIQVFSEPGAAGPVSGTVIELYNSAGQILNADNLGLEIGMTLWSDNAGWSGIPSTQQPFIGPTIVQITGGINPSITVNVPLTFSAGSATGDTINIGWANMIHRYDITNDILTLLVIGSFLNFSQSKPVFATNLLDDLLFWTDDRNQPRKINVSSANPLGDAIPTYYVNEDQISVAKYYPYETPIVLEQVIRVVDSGAQATAPGAHARGYDLTMLAGSDLSLIKIGDIVSGFPGQELQELWNVIDIDEASEIITIYNNFKDGDGLANMQPGTWDEATNIELKFSRTAMTNSEARLFDRGFDTNAINPAINTVVTQGDILEINYQGFKNLFDDPSPLPTPRVGDYIISNGATAEVTGTPVVANNILLQDEVIIESIQSISANAPLANNTIELTLNKEIELIDVNAKLSISPNPNYSLGQIPPKDFTGDPDLIEEKFIRFSYRFKFDDNEYSLAAPYTQICFIPDNDGYFGGGKNDSLQDQVNTYDSSIVDWFTNQIDTVALKIPLPDTANNASDIVDNFINNYKVTDIEILYKESDALSSKILEVIEVDNTLANFVEEVPDTTNLFSSPRKQWYYNFDYKSIKPYRTLPTSEQNRVYDNVPIKALGQEITANRVMYGNFLQKHTPPNGIDFEVLQSDKSVLYNNYAQYPNHSLKQNRNYQAGFVLADRYGRASSVVLSSNDSNPNKNGSTIYVPYKDWPDVGGPEANISTGITPNIDRIYSWLGTALRVKINNGITQTQNNTITGEPGLYKSENDSSVDQVNIVSGGVGHVVGDIIRYGYNSSNRGLGRGLETEVVSETGGVVTGLKIVSRGEGYVDGQQLFQASSTGAGTSVVITVVVFDANPTGWQSYKIVVKQQEQEYYNVYLGGYVSGYPITGFTDFGRVAFATLLGDNINKVPRDLQEVGPLQTEFSASVKLFGRVNNPSINNNNKPGGPFYFDNREYAWNTQYFPGRLNDEVVTVGNVGQSGLELANSPFSNGNTSAGAFLNPTDPAATDGKIPWGRPGEYQNFIGVEQNPTAMGLKVGVETPQPNLTREGDPILNTLGARVTSNVIPAAAGSIGCMYPYLSVSETAPVESQLEIFYESSTSGNFVDLNRLVVSDYGGVSGTTVTSGNFDEDQASGYTVITGFSFTDSAGNELSLDGDPADPTDIGVVITEVLDQWGNDVTGIFNIVPTVAFNYDDFNIETNTDFAYLKSIDPTHANQWTISFQTEYNDGSELFVDNLSNQITIDLNNIAPSIGGFTPTQTTDADNGVQQACSKAGGTPGYDTTMTGIIGQFTNVVNGSADAIRNTDDLCYSLSMISEPVGSTAVFSIDQSGNVSITTGTINGSYIFECTVTDASPACNPDPGSLTVTCQYEIVFGTPPVNQALCFGPTSQMGLLDTTCTNNTGEPLEVFFGANRFVNSGIVGNVGIVYIGSDTNEETVNIDAGLGALGPSYGFSSNNGIDLAYYNVLEEGRYATNKHTCIEVNPSPPPPLITTTPAFTTGGLVQGILAIQVVLSKTPTSGGFDAYNTEYTILYRATAVDTWQIATADASSPTNPGSAVGGFNSLAVNLSGAVQSEQTYYFSAPGEYAVRTNGVHNGNGCQVSGCYTCARVDVNFYDALYGPAAAACTDCNGPL